MIVGNGLLASTVEYKNLDCENIVFFASGVSNSTETKEAEFLREEALLNQTIVNNAGKKFVYFSSCSVCDETNTPYSVHKLNMERLVQASCEHYFIFRLPQVVGHIGNRNTLFNFICEKIAKQEVFNIWTNVYRNFIDVDNVVDIVGELIQDEKVCDTIINVASPYNIDIQFFVQQVEKYTNIKSNFILQNKGSKFNIDITPLHNLINIDKYFLLDANEYIQSLLRKYC